MTWDTNLFDPQFERMHLLAAALVLLGSVSAQDTYHCPDGWFWHEGHGGRGHCYFFSMEQLSKMNGEILCASHGGWIVEIPHPGVNYWIKAMLLDLYTPDKEASRKKYACSNGILPDSVSTPPPQANGRFVAGIFRRKWANSLKRRF